MYFDCRSINLCRTKHATVEYYPKATRKLQGASVDLVEVVLGSNGIRFNSGRIGLPVGGTDYSFDDNKETLKLGHSGKEARAVKL